MSWRPVLWLGLISLLTAIAGEAARAVSGPFLKQLGASAAAVGVIAGTGELLGYTLRLASGFLADRPGGAWRLLLIGTVVGTSAVPLLALAPSWHFAAILYLAERTGRALRTPARDVLLASASKSVGHGPGFGVHRLLDQIGAVIGPLLVAALLSPRNGYRTAFVWTILPSLAAIALVESFVGRTSEVRAGLQRDLQKSRELLAEAQRSAEVRMWGAPTATAHGLRRALSLMPHSVLKLDSRCRFVGRDLSRAGLLQSPLARRCHPPSGGSAQPGDSSPPVPPTSRSSRFTMHGSREPARRKSRCSTPRRWRLRESPRRRSGSC